MRTSNDTLHPNITSEPMPCTCATPCYVNQPLIIISRESALLPYHTLVDEMLLILPLHMVHSPVHSTIQEAVPEDQDLRETYVYPEVDENG